MEIGAPAYKPPISTSILSAIWESGKKDRKRSC